MNKKTALITDSGCDLPLEYREKYNIRVLPLRIIFSDAEFLGNGDIPNDILFERMTREIPKTSLPDRRDLYSLFDELEKQGYTDALYVGISSGISGTFNAARLFAEEGYNSVALSVVDSKTMSVPEGYCVLEAARELEKTGSIERAIRRVKELRAKMTSYIALPTVEYLRKGGRIGAVEGAVGSLLRLNPVITIDDDGLFQTVNKTIGFKRAIEAIAKDFLKKFDGASVKIAVTHGLCPELAQSFLERMSRIANVEESFIEEVSPLLGVHSGPGLLGMVVIT